MKPQLSSQRNAAMTLFEVGIVVAVVMILFVVFAPALFKQRRVPSRIACTNNLKQTVLSFKLWAGDNNDVLPMGISVTNGGSMELAATGNVLQTFLVMSNELGTPRILFCPNDTKRFSINNFGGLSNSNISYFISADMTNDLNPQAILIGDADLTLGGKLLKPGLTALWTNDPVAWSTTRHVNSGNIGLADGSVQSTTTGSLRTDLQQTGLATNRFALP
jgi:prepilin-type processing-associated H-X9-DG protein